MKEFDKIYVSWRKGQGSRRYIVGVLEHTADDKYLFKYEKDAVVKAKEEGFIPYTEFSDINVAYNSNVLDVFAQRLIKTERPDIQQFYDFWEIDPQFKDDKFYMLGHTQGLLPTDNFEFLADYKIIDQLHFLTELAGLSKLQISSTILQVGDVLTYELEQTNLYDSKAVVVKKGGTIVGYIKQIHSHIFYTISSDKIKLTVKALDKNGIIKRAFVKVQL